MKTDNNDVQASLLVYKTDSNSDTGARLHQKRIGVGFFSDTLQMAGNIGPDRIYWQGTVGGMVRIAPE